MSAKNFQLSPAGVDLGLGDQLKAQLEETEEERKKRLAAQQRASRMAAGPYGPATQSLFAEAGGYSA